MVIVDTTFSRIKSLTTEDLTIKQLEETLSNLGMELDDVKGDEIKVEITAERIDLISPEGLARAINCYLGQEYKEIEVKESDYVHEVKSEVKGIRDFTRSFVVKNLSLSDEDIKALMWLQEKVHDTYGRKRKKVAIGVYELKKLNFPIIYTAKSPNEISKF